jgi:hypothetical protein
MASTTSLTRFKIPSGATPKGTKVVLVGRLKASDPVCNSGRIVELHRLSSEGDHLISRDVTDSEGEYVFERRPRRSQTMVVQFGGHEQASPEHMHSCTPSLSKEIRVRVAR